MSRRQLLDLGLTQKAIDHRLAVGRLHKVWAGVYAVGRPRLTQHGVWMAAVLSCGPGAALSHEDGGALWRITSVRRGPIQVSVYGGHPRSRPGIAVHRRRWPGLAVLRELLDRQTFLLTDSELERRFLPIAREAGLPLPQTGQWLNGYKVDFCAHRGGPEQAAVHTCRREIQARIRSGNA